MFGWLKRKQKKKTQDTCQDTIVKELNRPPPRIRFPAHGCWDCKHYMPAGLDEPDDPAFCVLDGASVMLWQHCLDLETIVKNV